MYTQCPECLTIFEIDEDALQASLGIVHCGHCAKRFDALRTLSDTLPARPDASLAEQDPVESVPTLTAAVPPSAFERVAKKRRRASDAAPQAGASEFHPGTESGETRPPGSGPTLPDDHSDDWFADIETELTSSLIADATDASYGETSVGSAWQATDELPAQPRFADLDIPVASAQSVDGTDGLEPRGPLEDGPVVPADRGISRTDDPDAAAPPSAQTEIPFDEIVSPGPDESGQPSTGETAPPWLDEPGIDTPIPDDLASADADPASLEPNPDSPATPVYVRPRRRRTAGVAWSLGCLVLALGLAAQLAWLKRVELFRNPATHPWAVRVCQRVPCHLPPIRDIAKLELLSRDVRPDPHAAGALMVTTTVRNNASFRQPWPVVVVELTDLDNNPVAMRRFRPAEYMPDAARRAAGIAPGATAAIAFEVADPGKRAVAFQFNFE